MPDDAHDDYVSLAELLDGSYWDATFISLERTRETTPGPAPIGWFAAGRHRLSRRAIVRSAGGPRSRAT